MDIISALNNDSTDRAGRNGIEGETQLLQFKIGTACKKANVNQLSINDLLKEINNFSKHN